MSRNKAIKNTPYTFKVTSSCDTYVGFNLYFSSITSNTLSDSNIYYILTEKGSTYVLVEGILSDATESSSDFSEIELIELDVGLGANNKNVYNLFTGYLELNGYKEYDLYLYVSNNVTSNISSEETFAGGVSIKSFDNSIDPDYLTSITVDLLFQTNINIYKVATIEENANITNDDQFAGLNLPTNIYEINNGTSDLANHINEYITNNIEPEISLMTDENGIVTYNNANVGVYLIRFESTIKYENESEYQYTYSPIIISVPTFENNSWNYDITYNHTEYTKTLIED